MQTKKIITIAIIIIIAAVAVYLLWPKQRSEDTGAMNINVPQLPSDAHNLSKEELQKLYEQNNPPTNSAEPGNLSPDELQAAQDLHQNNTATSTKQSEPPSEVCAMMKDITDCASVPEVVRGICLQCQK
ncbi:MAG: hypothetical protein M0Q92_12600 [Methanoregula sp.]|jgi:type IV secretory pathway VirB10-like protein|nr:hypothetical protein [Methanoregula sp.]